MRMIPLLLTDSDERTRTTIFEDLCGDYDSGELIARHLRGELAEEIGVQAEAIVGEVDTKEEDAGQHVSADPHFRGMLAALAFPTVDSVVRELLAEVRPLL